MNELAPRLTDNGKAYIINALNGDGIVFTKIVLGTGTPAAGPVTAVTAPLIEIGLTNIEIHESYCVLTGKFDNANVISGFYMTELGVFAKNTEEEEVLYAYRYQASEVDYIPSSDSGNVMETEITVIVSIGDAEDVTAVLIEGSLYASKEDFRNHVNNHNNPHHVGKGDVGLENVENLVFGENVPVISDLEDAENLVNGDTINAIVSKLKFWIRKVAESSYVPTSGYGNAGNAWNGVGLTGDLWFQGNGNNPRGIGGHMSSNDAWRMIGLGDKNISPSNDASNPNDCGYLEIATADNGVEPIVFRQYTSGNNEIFNEVVRSLFLLDSKGDTSIPGNLWMEEPTAYRNYDKMIGGIQSGNDFVVIRFGANTSLNPGNNNNDGTAFLEFAVGDDGATPYAEPIIATQYSGFTNPRTTGGFGNAAHRAYILNGAGNTVFPGSCTAKSHPTSSDLKKKDVHGEVDPETAEALIMGLTPIMYNFKDQWKENAGFGAQDVYSLVHGLGMVDNGLYRATKLPGSEEIAEGIEYHDAEIEAHDDSEIEWNLNYTEFIPYMVRVIQSQQVRIATMEKRLEALEHELGGGY